MYNAAAAPLKGFSWQVEGWGRSTRRIPATSGEVVDDPQPSEEGADQVGKQRVQSDVGKRDLINKNKKELTRTPLQM